MYSGFVAHEALFNFFVTFNVFMNGAVVPLIVGSTTIPSFHPLMVPNLL